MRGYVVSYNANTGALTLGVDQATGAGEQADWVLGVAATGAADPASAIHGAGEKAVPVDADELGIIDSASGWALKKLTWAGLKAVLLAYFKGQFRERLTGPRTYYVRTDGNDGSAGLANTAAGAFRTVQKAIDTVVALDLSTYNVTIQLGDGTYAEACTLKPYVTGGGAVTILGNTATPANVLINAAGNAFMASSCGQWTLNGFKLQAGGGRGLFAMGASQINLLNINWGACTYEQILSQLGATVRLNGNQTISGSAPAFINATTNAYAGGASISITLSGTPAFSYFAQCDMGANVILQTITFTGSATGARYSVSANGVIQTYGGGASYLPGSTNGSASGGLYL
ncbi:MAG: hypothetical protein F9K35_16745 [Burkholderiaceae bacterium]|nr:MAG: hypothetical protein F9K35_16745 [Burkholderiaceae bacterium]